MKTDTCDQMTLKWSRRQFTWHYSDFRGGVAHRRTCTQCGETQVRDGKDSRWRNPAEVAS